MRLRLEAYVELPAHRGEGTFDHAVVHRELRRKYVAHTANEAIDVIDLDRKRYVDSIDGPTGVAGTLVAESRKTAAPGSWTRSNTRRTAMEPSPIVVAAAPFG